MNWKPEVTTDDTGRWTANGLCFATQQEAMAWARDLSFRWTLVRDYRAVESHDPVNYQYNTQLAVLERLTEGEPA